MGLDALFAPRAVAVIGASNRELTIGYRIIQNLLDFGYTGHIYPVNPKGGEIRGLKAYPSIVDTPDPVDVAHLVVKSTLVPECVRDCAKKGIKVVIVNTAGFREIGPEGAALEDQLVGLARQTGLRIFGPNCQGIINSDPAVRAYCNFTFTRPSPGHISIIAQSGGVGEIINQRITELGIGVRLYASNGNACDVSIPEIVEYYGADEQTRVIVVYIESLPDLRAFLEVATRVARHKPILAMKAGRTAAGAQAAASHTGGLMKQDTAIELIFEKAGVVSFRNIEDLCQSAIGFASQPVPAGNRVGMIANTGGPAIIATDELIENGMVLPPPSPPTVELLRDKLYPEASLNNPVDVLATAGPEHFAAALQALLADDAFDAIFLNFVTPFFVDTLGVAREIAAANRGSRKPIVATVMTEKHGWAETLQVLRAAGVPTYDMPETGARVLAALGRYAAFLKRPTERPPCFADVDTARATAILAGATRDGHARLSAAEGYELLTCYAIPVARYRLAGNPAACLAAADELGYPVAVKVDALSIVHKTECAAVVLDIRDSAALRAHAERLFARFAAAAPRLLVQEHVPDGREVIVGAKEVPGLGHALLFGLGGIYVEVLKDVSVKLAPLSAGEAREMIESLRAYCVLAGARNQPGVDLPALVDILLRVSQTLIEQPAIRELDINPILAFPTGAKAVDVRVVL
jgi:acetyltransferase